MAMAIILTIIVFVFCVTKNYDILISFIKVYVSLCHLISIRIIFILSILKNQYKVDLPIFFIIYADHTCTLVFYFEDPAIILYTIGHIIFDN